MDNQTMITDTAATTNEGGSESAATAAPAATAATPGEQTGTQPAVAQPAAEGDAKPDAQTEAKPEGKADAKPEGAPEKYDFKAGEGAQPLAAEVVTPFSEVAKERNLTQDQAQKVIDKMGPVIQAHQTAQLDAASAKWAEDAKTDKEFGGENLAENLSYAKKAMDTLGTPELKKLLNDSGLGNHPELIRLMYRAGKAISEDTFINGTTGAAAKPESTAQRMYPNMNP